MRMTFREWGEGGRGESSEGQAVLGAGRRLAPSGLSQAVAAACCVHVAPSWRIL